MNRSKFPLLLVIMTGASLFVFGGCREIDFGNYSYNVQVAHYNELHYANAVETLKAMDTALNNGELDKALEYFSDDATIEVINPPYLKSRDPNLSWTLPESKIDPATGVISPKVIDIQYSGKEAINRYLFSLSFLNYKSETNTFNVDGDKVIWTSNVAIINYRVEMRFAPTVDRKKIQSLVITFRNLILD